MAQAAMFRERRIQNKPRVTSDYLISSNVSIHQKQKVNAVMNMFDFFSNVNISDITERLNRVDTCNNDNGDLLPLPCEQISNVCNNP